MTAFEDAARKRAEQIVPLDGGDPNLIFRDRRALVEMAAWARRYEAEREATDAEVEAVARGIYENRVSLVESERERQSWPAWEDHEQVDADEWRDMARAALTAFRKAGMGGEG